MKVGSLVECVNNLYDPDMVALAAKHGVIGPELGATYVVRDILPDWDINGQTCIRLEELKNPVIPWEFAGYVEYDEPAYGIARFRELQPPMSLTELIEECQTQTVLI